MKKAISVILCLVMMLSFAGLSVSAQGVELPETFDLRDRGVVTPVKKQNPFGTCWSFATIAASEISILSELGLTYDQFNLDLSERHLAWLSYEPITEDEDPTQAGEGCYFVNGDSSDATTHMDIGGRFSTSTSILSSGIGPVFEEDVPYYGKDMLIKYDPETGEPKCYSEDDDWSVDTSMRFMQTFELERSCTLASPAIMNDDESCSIDNDKLSEIKKVLYDGYGIDVGFHADTYMPGMLESEPEYINTDTWSHWTSEWIACNHAVCIVGWDDNYSKENFLSSPDGRLPEGDGAWIVKNSWGAESNEFPNKSDWGNDGYFYLSYYDRSATDYTFYDYNVSDFAEDYYYINQYDFMPDMFSKDQTSLINTDEIRMVNVFRAEEAQCLKAISCENAAANADVRIEVFLLDENYTSPITDTPVLTLNRHLDYPGYYKIKLDKDEYIDLPANQNYSVAVTIVSQWNGEPYYWLTFDINISQQCVEAFGFTNYFKGIVNPGESYVCYTCFDEDIHQNKTEVCDLVDEGPQLLDIMYGDEAIYFTFDNLPIKTYCDPIDAPDQPTEPNKPAEPDSCSKLIDALNMIKNIFSLICYFIGKLIIILFKYIIL